jgi:predicted RNA binding protein YcfA (HicA-like mRNA interferase family)
VVDDPDRLSALAGRVTVPVHAWETLKPKTLAAILGQAGLTLDDLRQQL